MALRIHSPLHKDAFQARPYLEMTLSYENLNWSSLFKPHPLLPQPHQASENSTFRKKFLHRLAPQVNKEMPFLQSNRPPAAEEENRLVRNTVDTRAVFEMWTFQTKPGNSLLLAFKKKKWPSWCQGVRLDGQATQRGDLTEERAMPSFSHLITERLHVPGTLHTVVSKETGPSLTELIGQGNKDWKD